MSEETQPLVIETRGKWRKFETMTQILFEVGKTYKISVDGNCEFAVLADKPTEGLQSNEIIYTKEENTFLWILTR